MSPANVSIISFGVESANLEILEFYKKKIDLERFRELPRGRCILALDGENDIFKAREVLGDHMCIMGDVPASMLFLGTPDKVYAYCTRLIRELGPEGFILQSGCDIPANAKLENVQAMVAAATGS